MKRSLRFLLFVFLFGSLMACSGIDMSIFNTVTPTPNPSPTPTLTPVPPSLPPVVRPWDPFTIDTICLDQEYSGDLPTSVENQVNPTPGETFAQVLNGMNISVVPPGSACDAVLSVKLDGKALSEFYSGYGDLYTGGEVSGFISLAAPGHETLVYPIQGIEYPPSQISIFGDSDGPTSPDDYYFGALYTEPIFAALQRIWGPQAAFWAGYTYLIPAENLQDPELLQAIYLEALSNAHELGYQAVEALYQTDLKKDPQTLPYLVDLLNADGKDEYFYERAVEGINVEREFHEKEAVKAFIDCAVRERHENCMWYLNKYYGLYGTDSPEILQKWFNEKFP